MSLVSPQRLRQSILASLFLLFFVFSIAGCGSSQNSCGDGLLDVGEACDDGNTGNGDGCDSLCRTEVPSGDQNDDPSPCGNGTLDPGEICDDGNNVDDDGCDSNCTLTACGNGIATNHEDCDDGNNIDGDGCDSNCTLTACGNGILTEGEVCDDGNTVNDDGCDTNCTPTGCGNGALGSDEECDDGNSVDGDGCDSDCTFTACGNGILTDGEECDDGNNIEGDGCDRNCTRTACGNGVVTAGEECDDGNNISLDGCDSSCVVEPFEIEPNEDGNVSTGGGTQGNDFGSAIPDANGAFTDSVTLLASLSPVGDEDVFKFSNPGTTPVAIYFDIWNRNPGSCDDFNTIDTVLHIREADGDLLASNDNRDELGFDHCSSLAVSLAPGKSVYAHVVEASDNKAYPYIGYALQATYAPIVCGDGIVTLNETCDDGNTADGDGCSATCAIETVPEVEPNNTLPEATGNPLQINGDLMIQGSITAADDPDLYQVKLTAPTVVRFEAFTSLFGCNFLEIRLQLLNSYGFAIYDSFENSNGCSAIVAFLDEESYFIKVSSETPVANYFLQADFQNNGGAESEPKMSKGVNDTLETADSNLLEDNNAYVIGDHLDVDDIDVYEIQVPPLAHIRAELIEGDRATETCESWDIASRLTLFDQNGQVLADDDFFGGIGRGLCSMIDGSQGEFSYYPLAKNSTLSTQTYFLMVRSASWGFDTMRAFSYRLQVTFR